MDITITISGEAGQGVKSDSRRLVSLNNHFAFVPLAGLGHVPQEEGPQTSLDVVLPWLRTTLGLPSST